MDRDALDADDGYRRKSDKRPIFRSTHPLSRRTAQATTRMTVFREMLYDAPTCQGGTHLPSFVDCLSASPQHDRPANGGTTMIG
jgi:hypothetical protein